MQGHLGCWCWLVQGLGRRLTWVQREDIPSVLEVAHRAVVWDVLPSAVWLKPQLLSYTCHVQQNLVL